MALIKAFKGLRYSPTAGKLEELCCPPYDVISDTERQALLDRNPRNIIRLELPKPLKTPDDDAAAKKAYEDAGKVLSEWLAGGVLADDGEENIYVYEFSFVQDGSVRAVKGFIPLIQLEEFSKGVILPHENTLSKAKNDRYNLMLATGCNFSQIYSLYSDEKNEILNILNAETTGAPASEFTDRDGVTHKLWLVNNKSAIEKIAALMSDKKVFIADGHHRYETALKYSKYAQSEKSDAGTSAFVPMMLVNMENSGLTVLPTHRVVFGLSGFNYSDIISKSGEYFNITENLGKDESLSKSAAECEKGLKAFVLYAGNGKYTLMSLKDTSVMKSLLPEEHESLQNLDVSVLHSLVLERLFGIDKANMAAQKNLTYVKVAEDAIKAVDGKTADCCFLLNATKISEIRDVSLTGGKMPQKSTFFYPKLTTGLVMNQIFKNH